MARDQGRKAGKREKGIGNRDQGLRNGRTFVGRPYGTTESFVGPTLPTLKRGANQRCADGAGFVGPALPTLKRGARAFSENL